MKSESNEKKNEVRAGVRFHWNQMWEVLRPHEMLPDKWICKALGGFVGEVPFDVKMIQELVAATAERNSRRIAVERKRFEKWVSAPPYERGVNRWPNDATRFGWHGNYVITATQLAWEAWCAAQGLEASNE